MHKPYNYLIIDDEPKAIKLLQNKIKELYPALIEAGTYSSWLPALEALRTKHFDLLFLDISMPQKTGLNLLELVPDLKCEIVFVTAHEEYALNAFNYTATGYLLKPINDVRFIKTVDKALERIQHKRATHLLTDDKTQGTDNIIGIHNNKGVDYVQIDEIMYFEATMRYTRIVMTNNAYLSSYNIGKFRSIIEDHKFYQIHRSYIINLKHIKRYESSGVIVMKDGNELPVSKDLREDFLRQFENILK